MTAKDYLGDTLGRKEKAEEDLYFARRDRELIEALHRRLHEMTAGTAPKPDEPAPPGDEDKPAT